MNIKLKAFLLSVGIIFGFLASVYVVVFHPLFIVVFGTLTLVYLIYKLVLTELEKRERKT